MRTIESDERLSARKTASFGEVTALAEKLGCSSRGIISLRE